MHVHQHVDSVHRLQVIQLRELVFSYTAAHKDPASTIDPKLCNEWTKKVACHAAVDAYAKRVTLVFLVLRRINIITWRIEYVQNMDLFGGFWTGGVCFPHAGACGRGPIDAHPGQHHRG